jgi:ZIP family zinc transporter
MQVFVSLMEVLPSSVTELRQGGLTPVMSSLIGYLCFFAGIALCYALDLITDSILALGKRSSSNSSSSRRSIALSTSTSDVIVDLDRNSANGSNDKDALLDPSSPPSSHLPNAAAAAAQHEPNHRQRLNPRLQPPATATARTGAGGTAAVEAAFQEEAGEYSELMRTSWLLAMAITLHNLPEGLATFVGYMSSPKTGISIAISIALHNIPEGIVIGVPVYYATGSRGRAILWAALSGVAEPLGALIGLAVVLSGHMSHVAMGTIMAAVAGIMTGITFQELIPRSMQYDPSNRWTINGLFAGMAIMAVSLVMMQAFA